MSEKIKLPIYWRKELKVWHGIVGKIEDGKLVNNPFTAGNGNYQLWEITYA